ncbi:N-6 DNA methylase, partial [bacterium]|nr:N-6 DNA methylase [bacterium]
GSRGDVLKDAALVAFVSPDSDDWRFSLVKMDYRLDASGEKVRVRQELTPARRFSFLVGKNESSHTAQSRLVPILQDDSRDPTLRDLEEAFSVEKVTKEFFEKYRQLFHKVKEALDEIVKKDKKVQQNFKEKNINTVNFAKKLLGQIVFLYFLQKKGWFGVERDKNWGTGPKNFLRLLFKKEVINYDNFFNDVLEPLFYEALRHDRSSDDHYFSYFNCKIPFLNGGLFDPINDYNWSETDILLPNELFSNDEKTKEGDIGTGILDIFDRYNFTVKEDEPLEKEVAVDPEMLGKVFENLLEVKDRKSKGTYYTPREIVHYMCQQSLINYLKTECSDIEGTKIESLINPKVITKKDYQKFIKSGGRKKQVIEGAILVLWEREAEELNEKLKTIRICDPACGSGAFLVGMMQEIISARKRLNFILNKEIDSYELKRHTIQNCLYGVDIDPGAVEIAKLRLWLSLVVDEKNIKNIKPLPNLDYKIMQGNSLIELLSEEFLKGSTDQRRVELINKFKKAKDELFNISSSSQKRLKRQEINELIKKLFEYDRNLIIKNLKQEIKSIQNQGRLFIDARFKKEDKKRIEELKKKIEEVRKIKVPGSSKHFEWHINFSEVFQEKGGFDIVIANPPYDVYQGCRRGEIEEIRRYPIYEKATGGKLNAYKVFLAKSIELQKPNGFLCEIFQNSFLADNSASKIRKYFLQKQMILSIDSFPERDDINLRVFENAKMSVCILNSQNKVSKKYKFVLRIWRDKHMSSARQIILSKFDILDINPDNATIPSINQEEFELLKKISKTTRLKNFAKCWEGEINLTFHKQFIKKKKNGYSPMIKGAAVQKWFIKETMSQGEVEYLDYKNYLKENSGNKSLHHRLKRIVMQGITGVDEKHRLKMTIIEPGIFCGNSVNYILIKDQNMSEHYLLALLNSQLLNWFFKVFSTNSNVNGYEIDNLPIPKISFTKQKPFINLVNKILAITKDDDYLQNEAKQKKVKEYEKKIDQLVYKLYGLTPEEGKIVENDK